MQIRSSVRYGTARHGTSYNALYVVSCVMDVVVVVVVDGLLLLVPLKMKWKHPNRFQPKGMNYGWLTGWLFYAAILTIITKIKCLSISLKSSLYMRPVGRQFLFCTQRIFGWKWMGSNWISYEVLRNRISYHLCENDFSESLRVGQRQGI